MGAAETREKQKPVSGTELGNSVRDELQTFQCLCFQAEPMRSGLLMSIMGAELRNPIT